MTDEMPTHPAGLSVEVLLRDCEVTRTRAGGPGGQHRNKVETAIRLLHRPTGVTAEASERRQQEQNRRVAVQRLRLNLALGVRAAWGSPSELWATRTSGGRVAVNPEHADFPAMLAEALDAVWVFDADHRAASLRLGVSASQLVRFLKADRRGLELLNKWREKQGHRPLR